MQRSQRLLATALFAFIGFTQAPVLAGVLKVAPTGAQYTQIQSAVTAASNDDVILISPGTYYGSVSIVSKSLTLCSEVEGTVAIFGSTTVSGLTASQRVILSGLRGFGQLTQGPGLQVISNLGHVRVEHCAFFGADGLGDGFGGSATCCYAPPQVAGLPGAYVRSNTQGVSFTACEMQGGRSADSSPLWGSCICGGSMPGGDGLRMESTLVSLFDCTLRGGRGGHHGSFAGAGGAGCRLLNGAPITGACSSGSLFRGGNGGDGWDPISGWGGYGGSGIVVNSGTSVRLLDNTFVASLGGSFGGWPSVTPGPNISGFGTVHTDSESRLVMTTDRVARAGSVINIRVQGVPGQDIRLVLSRSPTFQILPSWHGTMLSLPGEGSIEIPLGPIPANGVLLTRYTAPPLPTGFASIQVFVQAYRSDALLGPKLAAGTCLTLLP